MNFKIPVILVFMKSDNIHTCIIEEICCVNILINICYII